MDHNDPNFVSMGINKPYYRDQEWLSVEGAKVRLPRSVFKGATVFLGKTGVNLESCLEQSPGWILANEKVDTSNFEFLQAIGVVDEQIVVVAFEDTWDELHQILSITQPAAIILLLRNNPENMNEMGPSLSALTRLARNISMQRPELIVYSPQHKATLFDTRYFSVIAYDNDRYLGTHDSGWVWWISESGSIIHSLLGGGSVSSWVRSLNHASRGIANAYRLEEYLPSLAFARATHLDIEFREGELFVRGYDVSELKPASDWGFRSHQAVIKTSTEVKAKWKLGALKRDVLNNFPLDRFDGNNAFGAFATNSHQGLPLDSLDSGTYFLEVTDESGYRLDMYARIRLGKPEEYSGREYALQRSAEGIVLNISTYADKEQLPGISNLVFYSGDSTLQRGEDFVFDKAPTLEVRSSDTLIITAESISSFSDIIAPELRRMVADFEKVVIELPTQIAPENQNSYDEFIKTAKENDCHFVVEGPVLEEKRWVHASIPNLAEHERRISLTKRVLDL